MIWADNKAQKAKTKVTAQKMSGFLMVKTAGKEEKMLPLGRYDTVLQMFMEEPRELDLAHLSYLRWMAERGRLGRKPEGPPTGDLVGIVRSASLEGKLRTPFELQPNSRETVTLKEMPTNRPPEGQDPSLGRRL